MADIDEAVGRLNAALSLLDTTLGRRLDGQNRSSDLETELQVMQDDRARLAVELESATARLAKVETATQHVGQRVHLAIEAIRDVLEPANGAEEG